jgi:hypothetical protein
MTDSFWVVCWRSTSEPVFHERGAIGSYSCLWRDPISAHQFIDTLANSTENYFVREVTLLLGEKHPPKT